MVPYRKAGSGGFQAMETAGHRIVSVTTSGHPSTSATRIATAPGIVAVNVAVEVSPVGVRMPLPGPVGSTAQE